MAFLLINRFLVTPFSAKTSPRMVHDGGPHGVGRDTVVSLVNTDGEILAPMARVENYPCAALPSRRIVPTSAHAAPGAAQPWTMIEAPTIPPTTATR